MNTEIIKELLTSGCNYYVAFFKDSELVFIENPVWESRPKNHVITLKEAEELENFDIQKNIPILPYYTPFQRYYFKVKDIIRLIPIREDERVKMVIKTLTNLDEKKVYTFFEIKEIIEKKIKTKKND